MSLLQISSFLHRKLSKKAGVKLHLKINDNRSTLLRVKWEKEAISVSLHRMFLEAPRPILEELASYLNRETKVLSPSVKAYMEEGFQQLDYSHELDLSTLDTRGKVYNLKKIYDSLNQEYFDGALDLKITWFGDRWKRAKTKIVFGLYNDPLKLIKIHRLLDDRTVPEYVIAYIVYHEMVHNVCPSYVDEKGSKHIHSKAFKEREKEYKYFLQANKWIKQNQERLFCG